MDATHIYEKGYAVMLYDIRSDKQAVKFKDKTFDIDRKLFDAHKTHIPADGYRIACFPVSMIDG